VKTKHLVPAPEHKVEIAQRFLFNPDDSAGQGVAVGNDCETAWCKVPPPEIVVWIGGNPLMKDGLFDAVRSGEPGEIDHFHQTPLSAVDPPGVLSFGCPECVHIHWRWSSDLDGLLGTIHPWLHGKHDQFGHGVPLIPSGSKQSVKILVTQSQEDDFLSPDALIADKPFDNLPPYLWYIASSSRSSDRFFAHGGFFNSHGMNLLSYSRGGQIEKSDSATAAKTLEGLPVHVLDMIETPPVTDPVAMTAASGTEVVYHFSEKKAATFQRLCVTVTDDNPSNLKRFELSAANSVEGPWQALGTFNLKQAGSGSNGLAPGTCQEFNLTRTTARFLKVGLKGAHDGGQNVRMGIVRLYGFTVDRP
jgi:hypothetical protein